MNRDLVEGWGRGKRGNLGEKMFGPRPVSFLVVLFKGKTGEYNKVKKLLVRVFLGSSLVSAHRNRQSPKWWVRLLL
jgi:hypothetical protein